MAFSISSEAFNHEQGIPSIYTCDSADVSPPLTWKDVPERAKSIVLIVEDPDAPDPAAPRVIWVHWLLYNIPIGNSGLAEGVAPEDLPSGTLEGKNSWNRSGYSGPCPPIGCHRYFFRLHALDVVLPDLERPGKAGLMEAMEGHVLAEAVLVGTYSRV